MKTRRRLSESLLPALRAVHRVAWPDRGDFDSVRTN